MKAALGDNMKNNIFSFIHIFYSPLVWKGHGLMAHLQSNSPISGIRIAGLG
jgi:hypothetical protein